MINTLKITLAVAALSALPMAASAVTVDRAALDVELTPGFYSTNYTVEADEDGVVFNFNVLEDLNIPEFSLSSSASGGSSTTMYEITKPSVGPSSFGILNLDFIGSDIVSGADYMAGETFQVIFTETTRNPISYTVSFSTTAISAVPVPAAGLLLMTALGGAFALRRKKA